VNVFAIFSLLSSVFCLILGVVIASRNLKNKINIYFVLFCFLISISAFCEFMYRHIYDYKTASFFLKIAGVWGLTPIFLFLFTLYITGYIKKTIPKILISIVHVFCSIVFILAVFTDLFWKLDPLRHSWGYAYKAAHSNLLFLLCTNLLLSFIVLSQYYLIKYYFTVKDERKKSQIGYIVIGSFIPAVLSLIEFILVGLHYAIPDMTHFGISFMIGMISYSIIKHELFDLTPSTVGENIYDNVNDMAFISDTYGIIKSINNSLIQKMGYVSNELIGKSIDVFFESRDFGNKVLANIDELRVLTDQETSLKTKEGQNIIVSFSTALIKDKKGNFSGLLGIAKDITEKKKVEIEISNRLKIESIVASIATILVQSKKNMDEALREVIIRIGRVTKADASYLFLFSEDKKQMNTNCFWINEPYAKNYKDFNMFSYESDNLRWFFDRISNDNVIKIRDIAEIPEAAKNEKIESKIFGLNAFLVVPVKFENNLIGFLGLGNVALPKQWDNTEEVILKMLSNNISSYVNRRKAEVALEKNVQMQKLMNSLLELQLKDYALEKILELSLGLILEIKGFSREKKGVIFAYNEETNKFKMVATKNIDVKVLEKCNYLGSENCYCRQAITQGKLIFTSNIGEGHVIQHENMQEHGHYCVPIYSVNKIIGLLNIFLDKEYIHSVEDEEFLLSIANVLSGAIRNKEMEASKEKMRAHLIQSEKMSAIGQLAGGVAHEINNPMGVILGFSQILKTKIDINSPDYIAAQSIEREAVRCKKLIEDMLTFSRLPKKELEHTNINTLLSEIISIVKTQANVKDVEIETVFDSLLPHKKVNRNQLQQVIINLCNNAVDAMPKGGLLKIATRTIMAEGKPKEISIMISDSGLGMSEEVKSKIFEPFYTTKEVGKGTGLGLSIVYEIVKSHQGTIEVTSAPGNGAVFTIRFPVDD